MSGVVRSQALTWLKGSVEGFCGETDPAKDESTPEKCSHGSQGFVTQRIGASMGWLDVAQKCLSYCAQCERCRYVSISVRFRDCSWFSECDTTRLLHSVTGFRTGAAAPTGSGQQLGGLAQRRWESRGRPTAELIDTSGDYLDRNQGRSDFPTRSVPQSEMTSSPPRSIFIGVISGSLERRRVLRCTWVGALASQPSVRVLFFIGKDQLDGGRADTLVVAVRERQQLNLRGAGRRLGEHRQPPGAATYTQYAKVVAFLRYAAAQPEPLAAKCDDDTFVQPQMLLGYTSMLLGLAQKPESAHLYAGVFEYYSWKPASLSAKAFGRTRTAASWSSNPLLVNNRHCGVYYCNCSPTGGGWTWNGWDMLPAPTPAEISTDTCVGPYAFAKGPFKVLSREATRWVVASPRFLRDTRHAERLVGDAAGAVSQDEKAMQEMRRQLALRPRLSEDAQMGYWMAANPELRLIYFKKSWAWTEWVHLKSSWHPLLSVHKPPFGMYAWLLEHSTRLWRGSSTLLVHYECSRHPPCHERGCAHASGQRVCSMYAQLPTEAGGLIPKPPRHARNESMEDTGCGQAERHNRKLAKAAAKGSASPSAAGHGASAPSRRQIDQCVHVGLRHQPSEAIPSMTSQRTSPTSTLRVAVSTLFAPNDQNPCSVGIGCALLPWCGSVNELRAALAPSFAAFDVLAIHAEWRPLGKEGEGDKREPSSRRAEPVVRGQRCLLSDETERLDLADCPGLQLVPVTGALLRAVRHHARRVIRSGVMSYNAKYIERGRAFLYKWQLWQLGDRYDAILHTDLDVDVLPVGHIELHQIAREWSMRLPQLVNAAHYNAPGRELRMLGFEDVTTPWNGGLFWAFPPADNGTLFDEGVRVLRAPWNATHGWERSGVPRQLFAGRAQPEQGFDGSVIGKPHEHTDWTQIDSGDLDQGFLLYMLQYKIRGGYYMGGHRTHAVSHYVLSSGLRKPWTRVLSYAPPERTGCMVEQLGRHAYLRGARLDTAHGRPRSSSACAWAFHLAASELAAHVNRTACCEIKAAHTTVLGPGYVTLGVF